MRFAAHILNFNQDRWILQNIKMIGPYVDRIYVSYGNKPWAYNKKARAEWVNPADPELLKQSEHYDKIKVLRGNWPIQHQQRNVCVDLANKEGFDYLFAIDADEFYHDEDLKEAIGYVGHHPDCDCYRTHWIMFWKDFDHVISHKKKRIVVNGPQFLINLKRGNRFRYKRMVTGENCVRLKTVCYHMTYVLTDEECWMKINTWGAFKRIKPKEWYNNVWLQWTPEMRNLHLYRPKEWGCAIKRPLEYKLPKVLEND